MSKEINVTLADLADEVLASMPDGSKYDWGSELAKLARKNDLHAELNARLNESLGYLVKSRKATAEKQRQAEKLARYGYNGAALNPTISVKSDDGARQLVLWIEATPQQFADAVSREQNTVEGRAKANRVRLRLVKEMLADESLMDLTNLKEVCNRLDVDPDTLGLDDLDAEAI